MAMSLLMSRDGELLKCVPFLKDPGLSRRLSACSAHSTAVHKSWPVTMLGRVARLSN